MDQPTCCTKPSWLPELDLGEAGGFDFLLGKCAACGAYSMNVFCTAAGTAAFESVSAADVERMQSLAAGAERKAFMRKWGDDNL